MSTKKRKQRALDEAKSKARAEARELAKEPRLVSFNARMRVSFAMENNRDLLHRGVRDVRVDVEAWDLDELRHALRVMVGDAGEAILDRLLMGAR